MNQHSAGWVTQYVATVQGYATLTREQELAVFRRWRDQGDERARDTLVRSALRFVVAIARKHQRYGVPLSELIAEGNFGIVRALAKFDPERGTLFMTYASHWIRACILQHVLKSWSVVGSGLPRSKLFFKLRRERIKIANLICERDEADALLAERLGVTPKRLAALVERVDHRDYSLEAELFSESNATLLGTLPSPEMNQEELALAGEFSLNAEEAVRAALELLDQRERYIVEHRLLADREAEISLADIGRMLGVSRERARQLETRAKKKLYAYITTHQGARDWLDLPSAA
ncbi:MAG TPA: sigma-70 family RNA polymerase sigma factor [Polyangiaceae bacterium]|jgi:RNA polymerase sigma-32 factor|nr:sigma-70 family RNA polymerase sigma factor [Polyangiaceae bacterium]